MLRKGLVAVALSLTALLVTAPGSPAAPPPTTAPPPPALPGIYVLVDADTGNVLAQADARTPHLPASTIKLLTALIAVERLPRNAAVPISPLAEAMPARKINVKAGQIWTFDDLLHSMLMVSANDAAVAIAERTAGSLAAWTNLAQQTAARLGLADHPQLGDPSGLDDQFAQGGGSVISARDLAIVARAVLARPDLMQIVGLSEYSFAGGDGVGHHFTNHDLFLGLYPGATGMKTGTTDRAGSTFVGSATRDGRTMLAVIFNGQDPYRQAALLLDQGFATPKAAEPTTDVLPAVVKDASAPPTTAPAVQTAAAAAPAKVKHLSIDSPPVAMAILITGTMVVLVLRRILFSAHRREWPPAS